MAVSRTVTPPIGGSSPMAKSYSDHNNADTRALPSGGGSRLRRAYLNLLGITLAALVIPAFLCYLALRSGARVQISWAFGLGLGFSLLMILSSFVISIIALITGRTAVRGESVDTERAHASAMLAKVGRLIGHFALGATLTITLAVLLIDTYSSPALATGSIVMSLSLLPVFLNSKTQQISTTAAHRS